jgi:flagellar protein FlgJ
MNDMAISSVVLPAAAATPTKADTPQKVHDAAQQFEALLMGQILRTERQSGSGWLGGEDSSAECATDYAEQQFAAVLAQQGGLGLADLVAKGLERNH